MGDQEQSSDLYFQETEHHATGALDYAAVNHFLMIMRNHSAAASPISAASNLRISAAKRRSPASPVLQQPKTKKQSTLRNSPASTHHGFTRLPLPHAFPAAGMNFPAAAVRRTVSDVSGVVGPSVSGCFLSNLSPEKQRCSVLSPVKSGSSVSGDAALYRSYSAPVEDSVRLLSTSSPESVKLESPTSHRLKRMKAKMKEMGQWWNQVIQEGEAEDDDDDDGSPVHNNHSDHHKVEHHDGDDDEVEIEEEEEEGEAVHETEEGVSVEKTKKGLKVQIKCPCGKGYHVFFSGKNCYYQLI